MDNEKRKLCDDVLRYGEIISDKQYDKGVDIIRMYRIKFYTEELLLIKCNGEWTNIYQVV